LNEKYERNDEFRECLRERKPTCPCPHGLRCYIQKGSFDELKEQLEKEERTRTFIENAKLDVMQPHMFLWEYVEKGFLGSYLKYALVVEELRPDKNEEGESNLDGISKEQFRQVASLLKMARLKKLQEEGRLKGMHGIYFSRDSSNKNFWKNVSDDQASNQNNQERKLAISATEEFGASSYFYNTLIKMIFPNPKKNWNKKLLHTVFQDLERDSFPEDVDAFFDKHYKKFHR